MVNSNNTYKTVDEYIHMYPKDIQNKLEEMRRVIKKAAPEATETISYKMPAYKLNGNLAYFAAFKSHIGFYPIPSGIEAFKEKLARYKTSKGGIQFPLDKPLPVDLIREIIEFRAKENLKKGKVSYK